MKMQVLHCNNNSPGHRQALFSHSLGYLSEPSSSDECNMYTADSLLNRNADTILKEFSTKLSVRLLHLVELASSLAGEVTLWLQVHVISTEHACS